MILHDPLCPWPDPRPPASVCACCIAVTKARADERERIAQALTDLGYDYPAEVARHGAR